MGHDSRLRLTFFFFFTIISWISTAHAQKNDLRLRIDTLTVDSTTSSAFINVYSKVVGGQGHAIYAYRHLITYDTTKIRKVNVFFPKRVTDFAKPQVSQRHDTLFVVVFGQPGVELIDSVMYTIWFSVLPNWTGYDSIRTAYFEYIDDSASVRSVLTSDGWIRRPEREVPVKKVNVTLQTEPQQVMTDSLIQIPVLLSDVTGANLKSVSFDFKVDPSVLNFVSATPGPVPGTDATVAVTQTGSALQIGVDVKDTPKPFQGSGILATLTFRASHRVDTVCTSLFDSVLRVLNQDARTDTISYRIAEVCVLGHDSTVVHSTVRQSAADGGIGIYPNPFTDRLSVVCPGPEVLRVRLFDPLGRLVVDQTGMSGIVLQGLQPLPSGFYQLLLEKVGDLKGGKQWQGVEKIH